MFSFSSDFIAARVCKWWEDAPQWRSVWVFPLISWPHRPTASGGSNPQAQTPTNTCRSQPYWGCHHVAWRFKGVTAAGCLQLPFNVSILPWERQNVCLSPSFKCVKLVKVYEESGLGENRSHQLSPTFPSKTTVHFSKTKQSYIPMVFQHCSTDQKKKKKSVCVCHPDRP